MLCLALAYTVATAKWKTIFQKLPRGSMTKLNTNKDCVINVSVHYKLLYKL